MLQAGIPLGIILLIVSATTGMILLLAPGSIRLQRPECGWVGWAFNIMNLLIFFLLIPLCSIMLIMQVDLSLFWCLSLPGDTWRIGFELIGVLVFLLGSMLLLWSRLSLRRSFRLGGVKPASTDYLTMHGPYTMMRHPMYLSALLVLFGLTLILASLLLVLICIAMTILIRKLIPAEEAQLDQAYPVAYAEYCRRTPAALWPRRKS